jgi:prepilin-type processing-associated H-X9-DG protein
MLARRGITKDVLKVGDVIKVEGFRAKDGSNNGSGGNVTFADGRRVFAGSAEDVVPRN